MFYFTGKHSSLSVFVLSCSSSLVKPMWDQSVVDLSLKNGHPTGETRLNLSHQICVSSFHLLPVASMSSCVLCPSPRSPLWVVAGRSRTPAGPDESPPTRESSKLRGHGYLTLGMLQHEWMNSLLDNLISKSVHPGFVFPRLSSSLLRDMSGGKRQIRPLLNLDNMKHWKDFCMGLMCLSASICKTTESNKRRKASSVKCWKRVFEIGQTGWSQKQWLKASCIWKSQMGSRWAD